MSVISSRLSVDQERKLLSLFGPVRLHLLYKASVHGYTAAAFHARCDTQGPTVLAAFNAGGFVFGAYTSQNYAQTGAEIADPEAFLYSITGEQQQPLRFGVITGQTTFTDGARGPNFGALAFLHEDTAAVLSEPGNRFRFNADAMHGNDLALIDCEVFRVEALENLLPNPWRNITWTAERRQQLKDVICTYKPDIPTVRRARVLLVGPVGADKSSFYNSINSVFRGNMTAQAMAGSAAKGVTTQFRAYNIYSGKGGVALPLVLCDTMGLEENADAGVDLEDLTSIYKGHMRDRHQFNAAAPLISEAPGYKKHVTLSDRIHCVVYLIDSCTASLLSPKMLEKLATLRKKTNQQSIPQLLLMTKVDEACPVVAQNLRDIYRSTNIQSKARELSKSLGIPLSCILPVKNYSQELELDLNTDILLLSAVEQMLNYADNYFENQVADDGQDEVELYRSTNQTLAETQVV